MGLKLIKNIDTQWALSKQRDFLGTKQATANLGGEAGTASSPDGLATLSLYGRGKYLRGEAGKAPLHGGGWYSLFRLCPEVGRR